MLELNGRLSGKPSSKFGKASKTVKIKEPVITTGRVVEIRGIKSIEFSENTLRFKF